MTNAEFTSLWQVQEPKEHYKTQSSPLAFKEATVHKQHHMQVTKANPSGAGRPIP